MTLNHFLEMVFLIAPLNWIDWTQTPGPTWQQEVQAPQQEVQTTENYTAKEAEGAA